MRGAVWVIIYLLFVLAPLFALLVGTWPPARSFWIEFSVALGYVGLAIIGLQFGLTARFHYVTEPWGEDVIYHFHREISLIAVSLVMAHAIIQFFAQPQLFVSINIFETPWGARFAVLSICSLVALVVTALWRTKLKFHTRRASHTYCACGCRRRGWIAAHGGVGLLSEQSLETDALDRSDDLLDWTSVLRACRQAAVHA
jgi:predicted ferric reductase